MGDRKKRDPSRINTQIILSEAQVETVQRYRLNVSAGLPPGCKMTFSDAMRDLLRRGVESAGGVWPTITDRRIK